MLQLEKRGDRWIFPIWKHPLARVLKHEALMQIMKDQPHRTETVLDYGAGDCPYEALLRERFVSYCSADYAPSNEMYRKRPDLEIKDYRVGLESSSMDCVLMTEVLEHLAEPRKAFDEVYRVLRPGGVVFGTVPFALSEHDQPYDYHRYTSFCLRWMMEGAGFESIRVEYVGDGVAVAIVAVMRVTNLFRNALMKMRLGVVARMLSLIVSIPQFVYYAGVKLGLDPRRVVYYKAYPLGFGFCAVKPEQST